MTQQQQLLEETVSGLFAEMVVPMGRELDINSDWKTLTQLGIDNIFVGEDEGGFAGSWQDARIVFYHAGRNALALPICETIVAKKLLLDAKIELPRGPLTIATAIGSKLEPCADGDGYAFSGSLKAVAWGCISSAIVSACRHHDKDYLLVLSSADGVSSGGRANEAGEPRDNLDFNSAKVLAVSQFDGAEQALWGKAALMRTAQISGALDAALEMSVTHVKGREQFGRPLAKFQAIQQQLAMLAEECAAVNCAAQAAALAEDLGNSRFEIAAAKLRANRSVGSATSIAHQVHGAIGVTGEYNLHRFTQRLWAWRSEFGNDRFWAENLGRQVLAVKDGGLWAHITALSDNHAQQ